MSQSAHLHESKSLSVVQLTAATDLPYSVDIMKFLVSSGEPHSQLGCMCKGSKSLRPSGVCRDVFTTKSSLVRVDWLPTLLKEGKDMSLFFAEIANPNIASG
jgi:hypothetical protein